MAEHWSAVENRNYQDADRMSGQVIEYNPSPGGRANADGSTSFSLIFPALIVSQIVSEPEKAAQEIAAALNQSDEKDRRIAQLDAANKIMLAALELAMQHGTIFDSEERMNIVGRAITAGKGLTELTP